MKKVWSPRLVTIGKYVICSLIIYSGSPWVASWSSPSTSGTGTSDETSVGQDFYISHSDDLGLHLATLSHRLILLLRRSPHRVADRPCCLQGPHLGHMIRYGPILKAKRPFGKEKS